MNIDYLKLFYEVSNQKSISKVALHAHISQPALSQQIQKLENELGYKLLSRSNKGVQLTDAGRVVERHAKNILQMYDNMLEDLDDLSKQNRNIRIGAFPTMAIYALPCTLYMIKEKYPNYNYNLVTGVSNQVEQNVINQVCDVGFIEGKPYSQDLVAKEVGREKIVVVAGKDYELSDPISVTELAKHPLILLTEEYRIRKKIDSYITQRSEDKKSNILFAMDSVESIKTLLMRNSGISFLPYVSVKKELYTKQLKEIAVTDFDLTYDIYIIYKNSDTMDDSVKEFIDFLKKVGKKSFC